MKLHLALLAPFLAAACATAPIVPDDGPVLPSAAEDTCNARQYARLIGMHRFAGGNHSQHVSNAERACRWRLNSAPLIAIMQHAEGGKLAPELNIRGAPARML